MATKTVTLIEPIQGPNGSIETLEFRSPKWSDIMELGEPVSYARSADQNMLYWTERDDTIAAYCRRLLLSPKDHLLLAQLEAADTLKVKETVLSFFEDARAAIMKS